MQNLKIKAHTIINFNLYVFNISNNDTQIIFGINHLKSVASLTLSSEQTVELFQHIWYKNPSISSQSNGVFTRNYYNKVNMYKLKNKYVIEMVQKV